MCMLLRTLTAGAARMDADSTARMVSAVVDQDAGKAVDSAGEADDSEASELLRLISVISQVGASDSPMPDPRAEAIMEALQGKASKIDSAGVWRERLGMFAGFLACTATLGTSMLFVTGGALPMALRTGAPPAPALAFAVASVAALVSLLLHRRAIPHSPVFPLLVFGALGMGSCAPASPEVSKVAIPSEALQRFEEGDQLWGVRDIIESGDVIWTLTAEAPYLRAYARDGSLLANFGAYGKGPGELTSPRTLTAAPAAGNVVVWDFGTRALATFDPAGNFIASSPAPFAPEGSIRADIRSVSFGDPFRVVEERSGLWFAAYPGGISGGDDFWNGRILRIAKAEGAEPQVLADFDRDLPGAAQREPAMGLVPVPVWDRCPGGSVAVLDPVDRSLLLFAPDGSGEQRRIALPWTGRPFSREEHLAYIRAAIFLEFKRSGISGAEVDRAAEDVLARAGDQLTAQAPVGIDLRCSAGHVWIQVFDGERHPLGYGKTWRRVSLGGRSPQFQEIVFPEGFAAIRLGDSLAIGVETNAAELQRIAIVRLGGLHSK